MEERKQASDEQRRTWLRQMILIRQFEQHDGWIDVPASPGLGVDVVERVVDQYRF